MGQLGVHFAIDAGTAERLLAAADDAELDALVEEIEEEMVGVDTCETDKAWDAIHRCLTDGTLKYDNGQYPLNAVILGGRLLYEGDNYIISLLTPDQVSDVAKALAEVDRDRLWAGYQSISQDEYIDYGTEDFEYTVANFADLPPFFRRAADAGRHVIFTVDQ
jgi:hypothetical protein